MKDVISKINITEGVSLVTVTGITNDTSQIATLLTSIAVGGITLDMIGLSPLVKGMEISLSFSLDDADLARVIAVIGKFKKNTLGIHTEVNTGNTKLCVFGEKMPETPGVAAALLAVLAQNKVDVCLITTSDTDISLLVSEEDTDKTVEAIKKEFGV